MAEISRRTFYYRSVRKPKKADEALTEQIRQLIQAFSTCGYRRLIVFRRNLLNEGLAGQKEPLRDLE
ncbi:hypothetical protein V6C32_12345 [Desulforamulus ruminis]